MKHSFAETDMYKPVRDYFANMGALVKGEVKNCDIAFNLNGCIYIVELKRTFNLKLIYQAIDRQKITDNVFVAIPRPSNYNSKQWKNTVSLVKRLGLGLITVAMDSETKDINIVVQPSEAKSVKNKKRSKAFIDEFNSISGDYNAGGINKTKIVTAFRERNIEIACIMEVVCSVTPKYLRSIGINDAGNILIKNYYGWFDRISKGVYCLSNKGIEEMANNSFYNIKYHYRRKWETLSSGEESNYEQEKTH